MRFVTLIDLGAGALPGQTPAPARYARWFPMVHQPPPVPPLTGGGSTPVADGVLLEWDAVDSGGAVVIYIIERSLAPEGPWVEVVRTTATRYLYSDGSGQTWFFRIIPTVRGQSGPSEVIEGVPNPVTARLVEIQMAADQATHDAAEAQLEAVKALALMGEEYDAASTYVSGDVVYFGGRMYRALADVPMESPPPAPLLWLDIGTITEAQGANSQALQQLRTDVDEQGQEFAAALTQVKASIGGSGNILNNAGFGGMRGWTVTVNQYGASGVAEPNNGNINDGGGPYLPPQTMGMSMHAVGTFPAGTVLRVASDRIAVDKIDRLIGSVYVNCFRCVVRAFVYWFDKNNNYLGESPTLEVTHQPSLVGPTLSQLPRLSAVMPSNIANVATARIAFEMVATGTQSNPYAWFVMPMLEKVAEGKSAPSSWVDGAGGLATATFAMKAAQDAQITIATDVNGKVAGIRSINDGVRSYFGILSDVFELIATGSVGMEIRRREPGWFMRFYAAGIQLILGIKFGQANNLCGWYGPNVGEENATKANGTIWADDGGNAYFGGSLSAGVKKNAVQTNTTVTVGTELVSGPFDTNGTVRQVTISFSRTTNYVSNAFGAGGFVAGAGANSASVAVYRKIGTAAETLWQTMPVGGGVNIFNEGDAPDRATAYWSGSMTVNDTSPAASTVTYRAVITAFSSQDISHPGTINSITTTQNLSIISVEN